jgi:hypothetical protein
MINFTQSKKQEAQDRRPSHTYHLDYSPLTKKEQAGLDWITILVGLLALIAVGGLIPFWMWVYFQINP